MAPKREVSILDPSGQGRTGMSEAENDPRREHGLKPEDPLECPKCGTTTFRH